MIKYCNICGVEMTIRRGESDEYFLRKKYCSMLCYGKSKIGYTPPMKGRKLNEEQLKKHSEIRKGLNAGSKSYLWKGGPIKKICNECSKEYNVGRSREHESKFCSKSCAYKNRNQGRTSENEKIRKSKAYKNWRVEVFKRDEYCCVMCRKKGGYLHADHIKPFALHPELRLDINNGRTLCIECHKKTETFGTKLFYMRMKKAI